VVKCFIQAWLEYHSADTIIVSIAFT